MAAFKGFKDSGYNKIAKAMGYNGPMDRFKDFLASNPAMQKKMDDYTTKAMRMARGGVVKKYVDGGDTVDNQDQQQEQQPEPTPMIGQYTADQMYQPILPESATIRGYATVEDPKAEIDTTTGVGQVKTGEDFTGGVDTADMAKATAGQATAEEAPDITKVTADTKETEVETALGKTSAAQTDTEQYKDMIDAAEQTDSAVSDLEAAQGDAILMDSPVAREIKDGELIDPAANAQKAAAFTEKVQAATATPTAKATVQGQLADLTENFDAKNPPAWAAGALRSVQAQLVQRGLGASSIAGQALIQATLESALPIAQADAATQAQFESQNLSNRQQRAMLAAQQRAQFMGQEFDQEFQSRVANAAKISDIANMNFTAEQQVALENSRVANSMELANLSNSQAMVMAEAAALANLDMANLNNRQQAAVQNAQNFLQADLSNLSNSQQTAIFKGQQRVQSLFNDQAAENAARQFNAQSQNQTDQFFAQLKTQVSQFNASQDTAVSQYNAGAENAIDQFNAELNNQRDQFNAQNQLVIAQSNAQWRRQIATQDTATMNRVHEQNATAALGISTQAYANLWQQYADTMEWAWTSGENEEDRLASMAVAQLQADTSASNAKAARDASNSAGWGGLVSDLVTNDTVVDTVVGWFT